MSAGDWATLVMCIGTAGVGWQLSGIVEDRRTARLRAQIREQRK